MINHILIPSYLSAIGNNSPEGQAWLEKLPETIAKLQHQWSLTLGDPIETDASCSWVAPCTRADGTPAIFKIGWPHMESEDEIAGLRFWAGDPTVYLFEEDVEHNAMLLERCEPGSPLRALPEEEQDKIIAKLLRRLWRKPSQPDSFRTLFEMITYWSQEALNRAEQWPDVGLAQEGLRIYQELLNSTTDHLLLATDLHAGNVLQAQRKPWLVIDPKPFIGDPAYDATQHLLNCQERLHSDPLGTVHRFADLLEIDRERVRLWTFARLATTATKEKIESYQLAQMLQTSASAS